jgi:hypothetical protein
VGRGCLQTARFDSFDRSNLLLWVWVPSGGSDADSLRRPPVSFPDPTFKSEAAPQLGEAHDGATSCSDPVGVRLRARLLRDADSVSTSLGFGPRLVRRLRLRASKAMRGHNESALPPGALSHFVAVTCA